MAGAIHPTVAAEIAWAIEAFRTAAGPKVPALSTAEVDLAEIVRKPAVRVVPPAWEHAVAVEEAEGDVAKEIAREKAV